MNSTSKIKLRVQNSIFYLLFVVIVGLLGWLGKTYHKTFDISANQRNSLHASTQQVLKSIDKPIKLTAYVPDDAVVHSSLKELVNKYKKHKKDISLEIINPDLEPKRAQQDGIEYSGQLNIKVAEKSENVSSVDEQTMINVLQRLSRDQARMVVFLEGHGERSPFAEHSNGLSQFASVLQKKGFDLQPHNILRTQSIPDNASFVIIAAPEKDYLEGEIDVIQKYLDRGGNLLWLHEPGGLRGLDNIEQNLGITVNEGTLLDANQALQAMLGIKHPAAIAIIDYGASQLTKSLTAHTLFPFATAIEKDSQDSESENNWKYQPLLGTLPTSWLESGEIQGDVKFDDKGDKPGPLDIGMVLTRQIENEDGKEQRVIVLGDSDFMQNSYIGQGSNLEFASNLFNWLSEDDDLLSLKANIAPGTTLNLTTAGRIGLGALWLVLPLALFVFGLVRWMRRRKR